MSSTGFLMRYAMLRNTELDMEPVFKAEVSAEAARSLGRGVESMTVDPLRWLERVLCSTQTKENERTQLLLTSFDIF